ncbi:hypothetical protein [Sinomonas susongensis]|uniref:hypothetical protein n=1 Tax=Sinomonas susongensis TaxID=1324851 RepID=UPI0011081202|nr:hypothetical protein [Sinomonas susongensis]
MYAHRAIVLDAINVLKAQGFLAGHSHMHNGFASTSEHAQADAVGEAISALSGQTWNELSYQQRQILLVAQATVRHYPQAEELPPAGRQRGTARSRN